MKMSGADFRRFMDDKTVWPEGLYVEDEVVMVNGEGSELPEKWRDTDVIDIAGGALRWDALDRDREDEPGTLVSVARKWLKAQNETRVVVVVPNARLADLPEALKAIGASVCK